MGVRNEQRGKRRTLVVSKECFVFRDCFSRAYQRGYQPWPGWWGGQRGGMGRGQQAFSQNPRTNIFSHVQGTTPIKWILSGIIRFLRIRYCAYPPDEFFFVSWTTIYYSCGHYFYYEKTVLIAKIFVILARQDLINSLSPCPLDDAPTVHFFHDHSTFSCTSTSQ